MTILFICFSEESKAPGIKVGYHV